MAKVNSKKLFGANLRKYRGKMTRQTFAEKIDKSIYAVAKVESGLSFVSAPTIDKICEVLNIKPHQLFEPPCLDAGTDAKTREYIISLLSLCSGKKLKLIKGLIETTLKE